MATIQGYTKTGVDKKMASRSNVTFAFSGSGTPELSAFPDAKTGDVIERSSDRAQWRVLGNTLVSLGHIVTKVNGQTGEINLTAAEFNASPIGHKHTISDITDLTVSKTVTSDHVVQRTTGGNVSVPTTPNANTSAASKSYVDAQVSTMTNTSHTHTHTKVSITDLETISTTATANHIVKRTTGGNITVPTTPNDSGSATSKSYVDTEVGKKADTSHTHTIAQITDLTVSTGTTADHVVKRVLSGNITVPTTPNASSSATSKSYVDTEVAKKADTSHNHVKANITDLETISTGASGNTIVKRNTDGNITVPSTPAATTSATSKSYVDSRVNSKANTSHTHTISQITDLTVSASVAPYHVVQRVPSGDITVPRTPHDDISAASKSYVDKSVPWVGTNTEYRAIPVYDTQRLYVIVEG